MMGSPWPRRPWRTTRLAVAPALVLLGTLLGGALAGCGYRPIVAVSDVAQATDLVQRTFSAWQAGVPVAELRGERPPVYVSEDWWQAGFELDQFQIEGEGELVGTNVRVTVTLEGTHPKLGKRKVTQAFLVTTTPALTIAREDR